MKTNHQFANTSAKKTRSAKKERAQRKEQESQKLAANAAREGVERKKAADALKTLQLSASRTAETTYNAGKALLAIKADRLYKTPHKGEAYSSFKFYVGALFKISEQYAYMLINAARVQDVLFEAKVTEKHVAEKLLRKMTALLNHDDGKTKILEIWKTATKDQADKTPTDKELTDAVAANKPQRHPARIKNASDILNDPNSGDKEIIDILRSVSSGKAHLSGDELETLKERLSDICDNAGREDN